MERVPIVDTIVVVEDKILMLKRNFYPKDKLGLLGGYIDEGESFEQAARREAEEESGYKIELVQKFGSYDYWDREEKTTHVFVGRIIGGDLKASREGEPMWIDLKKLELKHLAFPHHLKIINDYLESIGSNIVVK